MAYTGYKIVEYIDVNPQSPTYNTTRTERVADASCDPAAADWEDIGWYCETLPDGRYTGYKITTQMDCNVASSSYTQTRETRALSYPDCPLVDESPIWVMCDPADCPPYCEVYKYPSGMYGETGIYRFTYFDENVNSPTFAESMESGFTVDDWTPEMEQKYGPFPCEAVNTEPDGDVISSNCVLVYDEFGTPHTTGMREDVILDKNPYSDTYLSVTTLTVADPVGCPTSDIYIFAFQEYPGTYVNKYVTYNTTQESFLITSTLNSTDISFDVSEGCDWVTTDKGSDYVALFLQRNDTAEARRCEITLTQSGSRKVLTINLQQNPAPDIEPIMKSDKYLLDALESASDTSNFTLEYFAYEDGSVTSSGVTYEQLPAQAGETVLPYTVVGQPQVMGKKYLRCQFSGNTGNTQRVARFRTLYKGKYSDPIEVKQLVNGQEHIEDFDFLVFTAKWASSGGSDFDTATYVLDSWIDVTPDYGLDECPVGSLCFGSEGYDPDEGVDMVDVVSPYLEHGGGSTVSGDENVLVNLKHISEVMDPDKSTFKVQVYGNWYQTKSNGQVELEWHAYAGEGMRKDGYRFIPTGYTFETASGTCTGVCRAFSSTNTDAMALYPTTSGKTCYSLLFELEYDRNVRSAIYSNKMVSATGRDIRGYVVRNSTLIHGGNNGQIGTEQVSYDNTEQEILIQGISNFFNIINGVRYNASAYTTNLQYYSVGGGSIQSGWCSDVSYDGETLAFKLDANTSGRDREVDISILGLCRDRNVRYRFEITQQG